MKLYVKYIKFKPKVYSIRLKMEQILKFTNIEQAFIVKHDFMNCEFCLYDIYKLMNIEDQSPLFIRQEEENEQIDISSDFNFITYTEDDDYSEKNTDIWSAIILKRNFVTDFIHADSEHDITLPMTYNINQIIYNIFYDETLKLLRDDDIYPIKKTEPDYTYSYVIIKHETTQNFIDDILTCNIEVDDKNKNVYTIIENNSKEILYTIILAHPINSDPSTKHYSSDEGAYDNNGILLYYQCPKFNIKDIDIITNGRIAIEPIIDLKKYTGLCLCLPQNETYSYSSVMEENDITDLREIENYKNDY